jgi:hypothetical protein
MERTRATRGSTTKLAPSVQPMSRASAVAGLQIFACVHGQVTNALLEQHAPPLKQAALFHFDRLRDARRAAGLPEPEPKRKWSTERVIDELRRVHRNGGPTTVPALIKAGRYDLVSAVHSYVGTIARARRLAGIPEPARRSVQGERWDDERVIAEIIARHEAGESIASSKVPSRLENAAIRYFGSWANAVEAAGFGYDQIRLIRERYTKQEVIDLLRALAREHPETRLTDLHSHSAWGAMVRLFGSIQNALHAAGLAGWPKSEFEIWNRRRVIAALREQHKTGARRRDALVNAAAIRYFGSLRAACEAAGVPLLRTEWSKQALIEELRTRAARGEHRLDERLMAACRTWFGGVVAARRAAGVEVPRVTWSVERTVARLRERARDGQLEVRGQLRRACRRHFGSIDAARRFAKVAAIIETWPKAVLQRYLAAHPRARVRDALERVCIRHFGSVARAYDGAGVEDRPRDGYEAWSERHVLRELRRRVAAGKALSAAFIKVCTRYFGTTEAARTAAGVPMTKGRPRSPDQLLRALRARARAGAPLEPGLRRVLVDATKRGNLRRLRATGRDR